MKTIERTDDRMKRFLKTLSLVLTVFLSSCGNGGDGDGQCVLNCSNAVMNTDVEISTLQRSNDVITCEPSTSSRLFRQYAAFKVTKKNDLRKDEDGFHMPEIIEAPYIKVTPALYSLESDYALESLRQGGDGVWISATSDPLILDDSQYYLRGIITPQQNFCTNSCGVFEVEYTVRCPPSSTEDLTSDVIIEVRSGSVNKLEKTTITIKGLKTTATPTTTN